MLGCVVSHPVFVLSYFLLHVLDTNPFVYFYERSLASIPFWIHNYFKPKKNRRRSNSMNIVLRGFEFEYQEWKKYSWLAYYHLRTRTSNNESERIILNLKQEYSLFWYPQVGTHQIQKLEKNKKQLTASGLLVICCAVVLYFFIYYNYYYNN